MSSEFRQSFPFGQKEKVDVKGMTDYAGIPPICPYKFPLHPALCPQDANPYGPHKLGYLVL